MKLLSLREVIEAIANCDDDMDVYQRYAWVYADGDDPIGKQRFYLSSDHEEVETNSRCLHPYLEAATFADVLSVQKRQNPLSTETDYARALEFYVDKDTFLDSNESGISVEHPNLSKGLYHEYDLTLEHCPADRVGDAARAVSAVRGLLLRQALISCRTPPVVLAERVNAKACREIESRFAVLSLPLTRRTYQPLAWLLS